MKAIVILLDSLNRSFLSAYGNNRADTPHLDSMAACSTVFENHWIGSSPCMPARRDLFTGRLEFLERGWGPLEPFDQALPAILRRNGVFTHMITDHYHYFETSGEHYCQAFDTWDLIRGQEIDPWVSRAEPKRMVYPGTAAFDEYAKSVRRKNKAPVYGVQSSQYEHNKKRFAQEGWPCERTFAAASEWVKTNKDADNVFLMVEAFDPHEPFDCPDEYLRKHGVDPDAKGFSWSSYRHVDEPPEMVDELRNRYRANLNFLDDCLGRFLETLRREGYFEDTMIILTTDHGHMIGEHGFTGKNIMPLYNEIAHIPCMVHAPKQTERRNTKALTQNIDVLPTVLEHFNLACPRPIHGKSWAPALGGKKIQGHDAVMYGVFGENVNICDGRHTYFRAHAKKNNQPLFSYTATPSAKRLIGGKEEDFARIEVGRFLPYTAMPVFKIPVEDVWLNDRYLAYSSKNRLFDIQNDYAQEKDLAESPAEAAYIDLLVRKMDELQCPKEQYERLGLVSAEGEPKR